MHESKNLIGEGIYISIIKVVDQSFIKQSYLLTNTYMCQIYTHIYNIHIYNFLRPCVLFMLCSKKLL